MKKPVVWIIDSEQWPRAYMRAELIERGFDAVGFSSLPDAVDALQNFRLVKPDLIVLELRDQSIHQEQLDALRNQKTPVIALAGATELKNEAVQNFPWARLLQRPFSIGQLADLVERFFDLHP